MKLLLVLTLGLISQVTFAQETTPDFSGWRFGLGFTQQSQMRSGLVAELGFPTFSDKNAFAFNSIVLSYGFMATDLEKPGEDPYLIGVGRVMFENRYQFYKELVSWYGRIGGGYMHMNKTLHSDGGIIIVPIQFGIDIVILNRPNATSTFFAQVGQDIFLNSVKGEIARFYDGTQMTFGARFTY